MNRRQLLIRSVLGAAAVAGFGYFHWSDRQSPIPEPQTTFLTTPDIDMLLALAPIMLNDALSADDDTRAAQLTTLISRFDAACLLLYPRTRDELRQLFNTLDHQAGRLLLTGQTQSIDALTAQEKQSLLSHWREHFLPLYNAAYLGLHNLMMASFYGDAQHWPLLDYAGPPLVRDYGESS